MLRRTKLGELLDVTRGASLPGTYYTTSGSLIRLTLGNFDMAGGWKENTSKDNIYYSGKVRPEFILKKGDLITPLTEQTPGLLGTVARIPESSKYIQSQDVGLIKCKPGKLDPSYAYYLISSVFVRNQLAAAAQQTKIRHTSPDKIKDCIVFVPDIDEQRKIGAFLDKYTEKIENNNKSISILESLAKRIYGYWFLQFDFPDENGKPYRSSGGKIVWNEELKREIPEGWSATPLIKFAKVTMGTSPIGESLNKEKGIVFYQGKTDFGYRFPSVRLFTTQPVKYAMENDTLLSVRAPVGAINRANQKCAIGRGLAAIHSDNYPSYVFYSLLSNEQIFDRYNQKGTTFGALTKDDLFNFQILKPNNKVLVEFEKNAEYFDKEIASLTKENQRLSSLRDYLLPLLLNGQITLS